MTTLSDSIKNKRRNQNQKFSFPFFAGSPHTPRRKRNCKEIFGFGLRAIASVRGAHWHHHSIGVYDLGQSHHALSACGVIGFGNRCELGTIDTPEQNLTAFSKPEGGTHEVRPNGSPSFFQTNSDSRLRRDGLFFRQETGAKSEAILTHSICFDTKRIFAYFFSYYFCTHYQVINKNI